MTFSLANAPRDLSRRTLALSRPDDLQGGLGGLYSEWLLKLSSPTEFHSTARSYHVFF